MKKTINTCLVLAALAAGLANGAAVTVNNSFTGVSGGDWGIASNWQLGTAPTLQSQDYKVQLINKSVTLSGTGWAAQLFISDGGSSASSLHLTSGATLTSGLDSTGSTRETFIGYSWQAFATVDAGAVWNTRGNLFIGRVGTNTQTVAVPSALYINGGTVNASGAIQLGNDQAVRASGGGFIQIDNGGSLNMLAASPTFVFYNDITVFDSYINVVNGTLVMNGDRRTTMNTMIANGTLIGSAGMTVSYDSLSNKTTVAAIPEPATIGMLGLGALVTALIRRIRR